MSDLKEGELVLVDAVVCMVGEGFVCVNRRSENGAYPHDRLMTFAPDEEWLHAHPGVPVAALVEELEWRTKWTPAEERPGSRIAKLRAAREAAKKPTASTVAATTRRSPTDGSSVAGQDGEAGTCSGGPVGDGPSYYRTPVRSARQRGAAKCRGSNGSVEETDERMIGRCRKCRFWRVTHHTLCERITDERHTLADDGDARVEDYEGYSATFHPGPDFGCTLFEASSNPTRKTD